MLAGASAAVVELLTSLISHMSQSCAGIESYLKSEGYDSVAEIIGLPTERGC